MKSPRRHREHGLVRTAVPATLTGLTTAALLRRMRTEFLGSGQLAPSTVAWMYTIYSAHAGMTAWALLRRSGELRLPRPAGWCGRVLVLGGTVLLIAGLGRFTGAGQISGTEIGPQVTGGVYRYSRNPQYTGYVLVLAGLALTRPSTTAGVLTGTIATAYRWWVLVEEISLESEFGAEYRAYRDRTPRWLGLPRRSGGGSRSPSRRVRAGHRVR
ncbi:protein-S-isoprenylcysteine O-methyltransferase Ste14 [Saccharopolyspora lacisalsi]|uniref:Protein-S-isoprenylcysteine O-methyltransferase Ste14 n=1 Tax=Halosaccharopolyspora lacisalsi TaxID=1000566 RepID=A0A839DX94_9PSEU|nr:isoprenylcysteine carboxylmethyltransferase family protein [Halosaccharopolyspora lacisalsi]MBA8824067.1 protein-S-isoprenylcysteine O-methyltransferase Ste14 [Halosaccharopolyspora lacisalsi]